MNGLGKFFVSEYGCWIFRFYLLFFMVWFSVLFCSLLCSVFSLRLCFYLGERITFFNNVFLALGPISLGLFVFGHVGPFLGNNSGFQMVFNPYDI